MSISEKLGKARVPGFRSGKKWKMFLASIWYFMVFSSILLVSLAPAPETTASDVGEVTVTTTPTPSVQTPTPTTAKIIETSTPTPTSTPFTIEYDDLEYTVWLDGALKILTLDMDGISDASSVLDMKSMEIYGRYFKEDSQKYLNEIEQYKLSPSLKPSTDEFKKALENYILAGKYTELGAKNIDAVSLTLVTNYTLEGTAHLKRATVLFPLSTLSTLTPKPTPLITEYDDLEYSIWLDGALKILASDLYEASNAAFVSDMESMELYGRYLKEDSQKYLNEIEQYKLSPPLKPSADEFGKALDNLMLAGKYAEQGAKNLDFDTIALSSDYLLQGDIHMRRSTAMLPTT